jgi:hypothetical protein
MRQSAILLGLILGINGLAWAQAEQKKDDPQDRFKALEERIVALEAEVRALRAERASAAATEVAAQPLAPSPEAAPAAATAAVSPVPSAPAGTLPQTAVEAAAGTVGTAAAPLPVYGGATAAAKVLNPDISVIGDFIGAAGKDPVQRVPTLEMHESEVGLQAIIDPYARGDFFLSFGETGVALEEGYITFTSLPAGFVAKVGKMRSAFGVVNTLHNHVLPWVDRPLVMQNLLGGEDGLDDAGISVNRILPAPKDIFLEATAQVFRGDFPGVFVATNRNDVSLVGRLHGYHDLTESTNLDTGFSYARGHNDVGSAFRTQLFGMDATFRWKPLRRAIYHSFLARTELMWSRREQLDSIQRAFGFYASADYRITRRWTLGGRYDRSDRPDNALLTDSGFSPVLTYWPSEFSQIRGQYRFTHYPDGRTGNDLFLQFLFVLGAHGAHPF